MGEVLSFNWKWNLVIYEDRYKPEKRKFETISSGRTLAYSTVMYNKVFDIKTWDFMTERLLWLIPEHREVIKFERRNTTDKDTSSLQT